MISSAEHGNSVCDRLDTSSLWRFVIVPDYGVTEQSVRQRHFVGLPMNNASEPENRETSGIKIQTDSPRETAAFDHVPDQQYSIYTGMGFRAHVKGDSLDITE